MSLIDQGEGREVTLLFKVKLTPPKDSPTGETDQAEKIVADLQTAGCAALRETVAKQGYHIAISTAYFIY